MKEIIDRACEIECITEADAKAVAALADLAYQLQSRLESLEKDAARWREVLTNDAFVVCDESGSEYRKCKLEHVVDAMKG